MYLVDRFSRKGITAGPDLTSDRTRIELTTDQVISVCEFDIRNSILCIKGKSQYEGTAMKSGLGTAKSFFVISPCYQVQHGGYN